MTENGIKRTALITGGAGFIGSNLAQRLLADENVKVRVLDNFSRAGVSRNAAWLRGLAGADRLEIIEGDIRNVAVVDRAVRSATEVYHLAAQVAVTTSIADPIGDFEVNAAGTLCVLEAARKSPLRPFLLFTSTNKVYGALERLAVHIKDRHYCAVQPGFNGVDEHTPLDFHSPYGCSKGSADQYVLDFGRIYGMPTVVFRMSCIAGPRQFGNEDQGWVAHFLYSVLTGQKINVYGNGYQVRDILHVHDLVEAMMAVRTGATPCAGDVYNLGGGVSRAVSVIDMLQHIACFTKKPLHLNYSEARPGDQPLYIADTARLQQQTGWRPRHSLDDILADMYDFWKENAEAIRTRYTHELVPEGVA